MGAQVFFILVLYLIKGMEQIIISSSEGPSLIIPDGKIKGTLETTLDGKKYCAFQGMPFAKPPVGDLRFEEAVPIEPWEGIFEANTAYACAQMDHNSPVEARRMKGSEDCLQINVYVPGENINKSRNYEVLLQIHGGALMIGDSLSMNNPMYIMDMLDDMIFVSFNFRVGPLGFLSTGDEEMPGNNGLKDQILAMKWVKKNIGYFGGNPDSITLSGHSSGAACVHLHTLSPLSKGLFHRAHIGSGTAFNPAIIKENPLVFARKLAAIVNCSTESSQLLKECLKKRPASSITTITDQFFGYESLPFAPFAVVLDNKSKNPFLPKLPYEIAKAGGMLDIPLIFSIVRDEGIFPAGIYCEDSENIDPIWEKVAHYLLDYNYTLPVEDRVEISQEIKTLYMGPGTKISSKNFFDFVKIFSDRYFVIVAEVAAKMHSVASKSPVYFYYFNYQSHNFSTSTLYCSKDIGGIAHSADERYLTGLNMTRSLFKNDQEIKERLYQMYSSFAKTGVPSLVGFDSWLPTKGNILTYLNMTSSSDLKMEETTSFSPYAEFWRSHGLAENERDVFSDENYPSRSGSANDNSHDHFWISFLVFSTKAFFRFRGYF